MSVQTLRERMVDRVLWAVLPVAAITGAIDIVQNYRYGSYVDVWVDVILISALLFVAVFRGLPYKLRASFFPAAQLALGIFILYRFGIGSFALLMLFSAAVFTNIFFGIRAGLMVFFATVAALAVTAWATLNGHWVMSSSFQDFSRDPGSWIVNTMLYVFLSVATLISLHMIQRTLSTNAQQATAAAEILQREVEGRRAAEDAARASQELVQNMLQSAADVAIIATDAQGIISVFNTGAEKMLGYDASEVVGKMSVARVADPEEIRSHAVRRGLPDTGLQAFIDQPDSIDRDKMIWTYVRKDGTPLKVSLYITVMRDDDGAVTGFLGIATDVTRERAAQEALAQREERYRTLFEGANDAIFVVHDGRFVDCNPVTLTMFGCTRDQIIGETPARFSPARQPNGKDSAEVARQRIQQALDGTPQFFEWRHCRLDGTEFDAEVGLNRIGAEGQTDLQGIVRDITVRKRNEEEREKLRVQLLQSQKMEAIGQLAGGIAHDFNNLLHVMSGYVAIAQSEVDPNHNVHASLQNVKEAADRASALVRQLLAFGRRQIMQPEDLDLNEVIEHLMNLLVRVLGEHISFEFKPCPMEAAIEADRGMMEQVIMNLCVNARDAMGSEGTLSIATRVVHLDGEFCDTNPWAAPGRYVLLSVSDTGCGMDVETLAHIYEPFFSTKDKSKGTGLGLATVYGILRQHDGMINAYSEPGKGSTFNVYLPYTAAVSTTEAPREAAVPTGGSETILIAEDDESVRNLVTRVLQGSGYDVLAARDGAEAVLLFHDHADRIDMVVLDVVMPHLGGREAYDRIQAVRPGTPALFTSGYSEDAIHTNFVLKKGMRLLQKPYAASDLLALMREILDNR